MAQAPARRFITVFEDSQRWRHLQRRAGDIIICTPPKCGTTWAQGIVHSLLWPAGDAPGERSELSPWIDMRLTPIAELVDKLDAQQHQRFLKTHSPGDCIPFDQSCRYIVVYRDGRDALVSWANHRATMRPEVVEAANHAAANAGVASIATVFSGNYDLLFEEWEQLGSPVRHLASWWSRRHEPNVLFVHYTDLLTNLESEIRRIAQFLELRIDAQFWPGIIDRCLLTTMRNHAHALGGLERSFTGGAASFFYKGTNGRWREILNDEQLGRYQRLVNDGLDEQAAGWLERGSLAAGARPNEIGDAPAVIEPSRPHAFFANMAKQPANSLHAISERRVEQARADGLFDDLALQGKPIPDIDRPRQPGWWANQFVARERNKVRALQLEEDLRAAMPALWRLPDEAAVQRRVGELNATIADYNRVTTLEPKALLDLDATVATWRQLRNRG